MTHRSFIILAPFTLALMMASACGRPTTSQTANVFGPDNREETTDGGIFRAVGRLDSGCTGTVVGRNLVLTAAHCVIDGATRTIKPAVRYFRPNLRNGRSTKPSWVNFLWIGSADPENDRANDWAFLRVDDDLGPTFGTLPILGMDFASRLPYTVSLVGYSSDKSNGDTQNIHRGCYVMSVVDGKLHHDCDAKAGISGAPLLSTVNDNQYVVGVAVSEFRQGAPDSVTRDQYSDDYANVAIPATPFVDMSTRLIGAIQNGDSLPSFDETVEMLNPNQRSGPDDPNDPNDPNDPDQPDDPVGPALGQDQVATADVILQRAQTIRIKLDDLNGAVRLFRDLSYRIGYREVLVRTPGILGDVDRFGRLIEDIVQGVYRSGGHAAPLCDSFNPLISDVDFYQDLDSGFVPGPFVRDFERIRGDIRELVRELRVLMVKQEVRT